MYLLDTTVISEWHRLPAANNVLEWLRQTAPAVRYTSVIVIGEIHKGVARLPASRRRDVLSEWLDGEVVPSFEDRILPVSLEVATLWGDLSGRAMAEGRSLPAVDALIAATALVHDFAVVTRNARDFERCGARVVNPWA